MKRCNCRSLLLILLVLSVSATAQKKIFSYNQLFQQSQIQISKSLPSINGWLDDEHYLELRSDSTGNKQRVYAVNVKTGKGLLYTAEKKEERSLPNINGAQNISFSPDGKWVAYTKQNDLYAMEFATKKEIRFTNDGSDLIKNGYASWIYFEEILGRASRYKAFWWAHDSKQIAFMRFDDTQVPVFPIFVADGQHGYLENTRYPKPGDKNPEVKIGICSIENPEPQWADFNEKDDQYFGTPEWTPTNNLTVRWMNRDQTNLKLYHVTPQTGARKEIYDEKQSTWIDLGGPNSINFLKNGNFIIRSDKDGWQNLYLHSADGKLMNQVTTGKFWGTSILKLDEKAGVLYLRARKENSARFDIYKVRITGNRLQRLSFGEYNFENVSVSPNGKYIIASYSNLATPATMILMDGTGKKIREIGNTIGKDCEAYDLPRTVLTSVKSSDGLFDLPVTITYPLNFDSTKRYPVLVSIYGGPNSGTVYDRWKPVGGITQWWAQEGIIQVAFDNRSSGHFGKEGLNFIHRQMGKWEIEDYMQCGRYLRSMPWVDTTRFAITGGSFGGYLTCMALTYGSDIFTHGIANASVTDWQLYDTHYTERFMDTPGENPEGYKTTSVLNYAEKYKGLLRIVHGSSDDNVHMQNSMQLINKLQDMNRHFEFMIYPNERHSIGANNPLKGLHNRTEAYQFLYKNLLAKPLPEEFREAGRGRRAAF